MQGSDEFMTRLEITRFLPHWFIPYESILELRFQRPFKVRAPQVRYPSNVSTTRHNKHTREQSHGRGVPFFFSPRLFAQEPVEGGHLGLSVQHHDTVDLRLEPYRSIRQEQRRVSDETTAKHETFLPNLPVRRRGAKLTSMHDTSVCSKTNSPNFIKLEKVPLYLCLGGPPQTRSRHPVGKHLLNLLQSKQNAHDMSFY